jgi:hypothetical protein
MIMADFNDFYDWSDWDERDDPADDFDPAEWWSDQKTEEEITR